METIERWRYPRFFTESINGQTALVTGEDVKHITTVLRMRAGSAAVLCDGKGTDFLCELAEITGEGCVFRILETSPNAAEPNVRVRLFQAVPKSDKMDFIVQKAVECGAAEVIPIFTKRCVSRPDEKALAKKLPRWRKIALEAAKQCGRGVVPTVGEAAELSALAERLAPESARILFYECADTPLDRSLVENKGAIDIVIGSEGGFEPYEAEALVRQGFAAVSLGKRILRCETAPIAALAVLMNMTGNM